MKKNDYLKYAVYFLNKKQGVVTKTIRVEEGSIGWEFPSIVSYKLKSKGWDENVLEIYKETEQSTVDIYSYNVQRRLKMDNINESFFKTVSNSSWANKAYMIVYEMDAEDRVLKNKLDQLTEAFGIGIIKIEEEDVNKSFVLKEARYKRTIDARTMNFLAKENENFEVFIAEISNSIKINEYNKFELDEVLTLDELKKITQEKKEEFKEVVVPLAQEKNEKEVIYTLEEMLDMYDFEKNDMMFLTNRKSIGINEVLYAITEIENKESDFVKIKKGSKIKTEHTAVKEGRRTSWIDERKRLLSEAKYLTKDGFVVLTEDFEIRKNVGVSSVILGREEAGPDQPKNYKGEKIHFHKK